MSCGLNDKLYARDDDSLAAGPVASVALGFVMVTSEKAAVVGSDNELVADRAVKWEVHHTIVHPLRPVLSFLQTEGSLSATIVVILVNMEDFLVRA